MRRNRFLFKASLLAVINVTLVASASGSEVTICNSRGSLTFTLRVPEYSLDTLLNGEGRIIMEGASFASKPGHPRLPVLTYTFALPPGSEISGVEISGSRDVIARGLPFEASAPSLPFSGSKPIVDLMDSIYSANKTAIYSGAKVLSEALGELRSTSNQREYSLATVSVFPFYYDPMRGELEVARQVNVTLDYAPVEVNQAEFIKKFIEKGTIYPDVPDVVFNKDQAREWYNPSDRLLSTPGMIILTTEDDKPYIDSYVAWRKSTGFEVTVVTKEEVLASGIEGIDVQQKVRNWLRANASGYDYLFIIAINSDLPMRKLSGITEDPFNDPEFYPNPADIYYGDLSKPDSLSWDVDADGLFGEAEDWTGVGAHLDKPDLDLELHVGRIGFWQHEKIAQTLKRICLFEDSKNLTYKKTSVLAGGILFYLTPGERIDGATFMQFLKSEQIVNPSLATTLYEIEGDDPSSYKCDVPFTNENLVSALAGSDAGVFVENNHGSSSTFARCLWYDNNGDGQSEDAELVWPLGLSVPDAANLNHSYPNVAFLMSCLNGYPESFFNLAQALLNETSVGVLAHTRVSWGSDWKAPGDGGDNDQFYCILKNYLKDYKTYDYVLGNAVDAARAKYFNEDLGTGFLNAYGLALYGDPALRHMGRVGTLPGIEELEPRTEDARISLITNSEISFSIPSRGSARVRVWDVAGRLVETLYDAQAVRGTTTIPWDKTGLSCGSYFITLETANITRALKTVVISR